MSDLHDPRVWLGAGLILLLACSIAAWLFG